jgi:hypothetical protein
VYLSKNDWIFCFFTDVIGVLTGMSAEREYLRDGKITKMIIVELTDHRWIGPHFFVIVL